MRTTQTDMNRTGAATSPIHTKAMEKAAQTFKGPPGSESAMGEIREAYSTGADPIGTVPIPTTIKGAAGTAGKALTGQFLSVLVDKLGERLAFERQGARLYEALLCKLEVSPARVGSITPVALTEIMNEEISHAGLLIEEMNGLGADPTAMTPSADLAGVQAIGLVQTITDPRTSMTQCLQAILAAELIDNACWELLIELAEGFGKDELAANMRVALRQEEEHLRRVRGWLTEYVQSEAGISP